ncbi:MAG: hypothetical protein ACTSRH_16755 [Promethearchaeota archaeon]
MKEPPKIPESVFLAEELQENPCQVLLSVQVTFKQERFTFILKRTC